MTKPDHLTHLRGNLLVEKDDPVIAFRGKLDTLCAAILEAQLLGQQMETPAFVADLREILDFTRSILPAEYKERPMGEFRLLGLTASELRERCRHPERHLGRRHLLADMDMGALSLRLNLLRTLAREAEIAAVAAFRPPSPYPDSHRPTPNPRPDIIEALNGLSSLLYVLTYKYLPAGYCAKGDPGI